MKKGLGIILLFCFSLTKGQDFQFTQYFASPLTLNPALTGNFNEDFRLALNHRNQWRGNFVTSSFSADMNFRGGKLKRDKVGVGLIFYNDALGENIININCVMISAAYHHTIGIERKHHVSFGFQGGMVQKSIDPSGFTFNSQVEDFIINPDLSSGENFSFDNFANPNFHLGTIYSYDFSERLKLYSGVSVFSLTTPNESFRDASDKNSLNRRYTINLGGIYLLRDNLLISPRLLYSLQAKQTTLNLGGEMGYGVKGEEIMLLGGIWGRLRDAAIISAGVKYKKITTRFSYDVPIDEHHPGAYEFSLVYTGFIKRFRPSHISIPCGIL